MIQFDYFYENCINPFIYMFQITDMDIMKEAEPTYFIEVVLPLLRRNGVVHFLGFGNRLAFDPLPLHLQVHFRAFRS